jgi:hypothetical protein
MAESIYGISKKNLGWWIRSTHIAMPYITLTVILFAEQKVVNIVLLIILSINMMFILLGRCVLTDLEQKLLGDEVYAIDLFIEMLGVVPDDTNRYYFTIVITLCSYAVLYTIYNFRFVKPSFSRAEIC